MSAGPSGRWGEPDWGAQPGGGEGPTGPGDDAGRGPRGSRRRRQGSRGRDDARRPGPDVLLLVLGIVGVVVAVLSLLHELADWGATQDWVAPTAALAAGGVLLVVGLIGLLTRRDR